jgi:hypothetical protein
LDNRVAYGGARLFPDCNTRQVIRLVRHSFICRVIWRRWNDFLSSWTSRMKIVSVDLISNPLNWLIVWTMLALGIAGMALVLEYAKGPAAAGLPS